MTNYQDQVRVRFAPSPTGHLHIGGLRSALFNWLFARHNKGVFLLRIEDTDLERSKKEYTDSIMHSFSWMQLTWDEPVVIQSERIARHREVAHQLLEQKKAYFCGCTQEDVIARLSGTAGFDANFIKYDGFCRTKNHSTGAVRFKLPDKVSTVEWHDLIRGHISIGIEQIDDFIIVRSDGTPMYNFVVVVDDADMRISHVIRGEEHIANTPKQILLYHGCHFGVPHFAHLPMILGPDGNKLSKRDAATGVFEYQHKGYLPEALCNYLVRLGWSHGDQEIFTKQEMIDSFSLDHVGKKGAIFDQEKLDWLNGVYIRACADQEIFDLMVRDISPSFATDLPLWHMPTILSLINLYKQRAKTLQELRADIQQLYASPAHFNSEDITKWIAAPTKEHLQRLTQLLHDMSDFNNGALAQFLKEWTTAAGIKMVAIAQPLRIALVGKSSGPGVIELMSILGKHETIRRINFLVKYLEQ
jgi:glutamyl-tRNA synthetase